MCVNRIVFFFFAFLFLTTGFSFSQKTTLGLQSEGYIPKKFTEYTTISLKSNIKEKTLFTHAFIIYGTDLNQYLDRFLLQLLSEEPTLKQQVKIFLYRSNEPNIYTTSDSIILINIGLLARIQNESELAFILSHELAHIYNHHSLISDKFSKKEMVQHSDLMNKEHFRSEEDELEADQFGYTHFFLPQGFKTQDIQNVFMCFEPEETSEMSDFAQKRIEKFNSYKQQNSIAYTKDADFEFDTYKKVAVDESLKLYLIYHDYSNALYHSSLLIRQYPEDPFYKTIWLSSNYGVLKMRENDPDFKWVEDSKLSIYKKEIQNTYSQLSLSDLKSKVFQIANDLLKEFPENSYYLSLIQNLNGLIETQKEPFFSNNLVVFDPTYHKINKESESIQNLDQELMNILSFLADKTKSNLLLRNYSQLSFNNTQEYNQYGQLQLLKYSVLKYTDTNFVYFPILENKKVDQVNNINFINIQYRSVPDRFITRFYYLPLILLNPSSLPFTAAHVFANRERMKVQFVIFDIQTNTIQYKQDQTFADFNGKSILKQFLFDQFIQISKP